MNNFPSSAHYFDPEKFSEYQKWLKDHMPESFNKHIAPQDQQLLAHYLMGFPMQDYFSIIALKDKAFVIALDSPDVDLKILSHFDMGIRSYQTFLSDVPPPFPRVKHKLRIAQVLYTLFHDDQELHACMDRLPIEKKDAVYKALKEKFSALDFHEYQQLVCNLNAPFLQSLSTERLIWALSMIYRAKTRDSCQWELKKNENWNKGKGIIPSVQIVLAWKNTPKYHFLHRLAKVIFRHDLKILYINTSYVQDIDKNNNIFVLSLGLHGLNHKAAWDVADLDNFQRELVLVKYFSEEDVFDKVFLKTKLLHGNAIHFLRTARTFVHQLLSIHRPYFFSLENITESLCRHPDLTQMIVEGFKFRFNPKKRDEKAYNKVKEQFFSMIERLDTGNTDNDERRKSVLKMAFLFVDCALKTNYFIQRKTALSFRIDPIILKSLPFDHTLYFPEIPYGIFYINGLHFVGFHIRFKDLSRGGLRTIVPKREEDVKTERTHVFLECYNLAYTQQKKNKDIPEGGSKAIIFLDLYYDLTKAAHIHQLELKKFGKDAAFIEQSTKEFIATQKQEFLYQAQRSYIRNLLVLINCDSAGKLKDKEIIDYYKKPEFIYLGPDENMHNVILEWIANYSKRVGYKPGAAFISSKPKTGFNHKELGVTSHGVNVCMNEVLLFLGIDPKKDPFTIKLSGGPDGDVAGNQILNLYNHYEKTAKLIALTDGSGTIYDPQGLDLKILVDLFKKVKAINAYPTKKLSADGFLLNLHKKEQTGSFETKTLLSTMTAKGIEEKYISGNEMNFLYRHSLHKTKTDIFIPAGGRPQTLNKNNFSDFLDSEGKPTSKAIIEGANLYLTPMARKNLEKLGVIIIKDSSANKGGVISSSLEVLIGLTMDEKTFIENKAILAKQVLDSIHEKAELEAQLILKTHKETGESCTSISEKISTKINTYTYEILSYLEDKELPTNPKDPLNIALLNFCPPFISKNFQKNVLEDLPSSHKKAIIASYLSSRVVYKKSLTWSPSIIDVLPLISKDPHINPH
ncbi:glutamate dehydrogenase [Candidatus Aerophobetes bacterium]|uniref:Glutamate dehydrogenase n=1 Tax=Aerophobetes bacterium TaxID=2030807 RepID=A0A2A4X1H5_UNCAE|nr:MAG: glutamate dehydrogenase [Candidatus Aerophobetes bacterium]